MLITIYTNVDSIVIKLPNNVNITTIHHMHIISK